MRTRNFRNYLSDAVLAGYSIFAVRLPKKNKWHFNTRIGDFVGDELRTLGRTPCGRELALFYDSTRLAICECIRAGRSQTLALIFPVFVAERGAVQLAPPAISNSARRRPSVLVIAIVFFALVPAQFDDVVVGSQSPRAE